MGKLRPIPSRPVKPGKERKGFPNPVQKFTGTCKRGFPRLCKRVDVDRKGYSFQQGRLDYVFIARSVAGWRLYFPPRRAFMEDQQSVNMFGERKGGSDGVSSTKRPTLYLKIQKNHRGGDGRYV